MTKQVFEGLKVCDLTWEAAGPLVSRELAFYGATVIHVESHRRPPQTRLGAPAKNLKPDVNHSDSFCTFNCMS